ANPSAQDLLGDAIVGRGLLELAEPAFLDQLGRGLNLARDGSWIGELDLKRLDGETVPVELSLAAGSGEGAPAVGLWRDLRALRVIVLTRFGGNWERWECAPDSSPRFVTLAPQLGPPSAWTRDAGIQRLELDDEEQLAELEALIGELHPAAAAIRVTLRATGGVVGHLICTFDRRTPWRDEEFGLFAQLAPQLAMGLANGLLMLETRALAAYQSRVLDQTAV